MKDKEQFGRTRNSLMKYLRVEYGNDVADIALRRINKEELKAILEIRRTDILEIKLINYCEKIKSWM